MYLVTSVQKHNQFHSCLNELGESPMNFTPCSRIYVYCNQMMHNITISCQTVVLKKPEKWFFISIKILLVKAKLRLSKLTYRHIPQTHFLKKILLLVISFHE